MSYVLGDATLPRPVSFEREMVEKSQKIITLNNTTKKDISGRKERFILEFKHLTQSEANSIIAEYNLQTTRNFSVSETNLTITATPVHIEIERRSYNTPGNEYREDLTLYLEEVI